MDGLSIADRLAPAFQGRPRPYLMAHRGNRVACPENTLAAFRHALADGADIIETDLHLTADGVFVCIHDATVDRTTDGSGEVARMTLAELQGLSAACGRPDHAAERVPTLAETAALLPPTVCLLYTSDAADDLPCVAPGGRRLLKKKNKKKTNITRHHSPDPISSFHTRAHHLTTL